MNAAKAITTTSSAVTGRNETPTPTPTPTPTEMNTENAVNETATATATPEEKIKEIEAEIKKKHELISVCTRVLYATAFKFRRRKERLLLESSSQTTQTDEKSKILKRKHQNQQCVETFKEDVEPLTATDSAETCALTGSIQKLDLQEETEKQTSDSEKTERNIKKAVRMMAALRGSSSHSDSDYAVFRNLKGSFDDHFRDLLRQNGVLGSTNATMEGGKKEINTDSVIQSLAKCYAKEMKQTFFGSKSVLDPSDGLDIVAIKVFESLEFFACDLYRLYLAEELEKNKMVNNSTNLSEA